MEPLHACPMRFLRPEKKNIMTCKHDESTMNIAEVKIVIETRHLLTEFSVPVYYQLPNSYFAQWFCIIHIYQSHKKYTYLIFFFTSVLLFLELIYTFTVNLGKSNTLEINYIILFCIPMINSQSVDCPWARIWKLLNFPMRASIDQSS